MALFKINRGNRATLPAKMTDGWAYFCTNTGEFFIDFTDANGTLCRKQINAAEASKLVGYNIADVVNHSDVEIPTSVAVLNALSNKADLQHTHNAEDFTLTDTVTGSLYNLCVSNSKLLLVPGGEAPITYGNGDEVMY